jgi:hypothetical protein
MARNCPLEASLPAETKARGVAVTGGVQRRLLESQFGMVKNAGNGKYPKMMHQKRVFEQQGSRESYRAIQFHDNLQFHNKEISYCPYSTQSSCCPVPGAASEYTFGGWS